MISTHTIVGSFTPAACLAYAASGGALASVLGYTGLILLTSAMVLGIVTVALLVIITVADKLIDYLENGVLVIEWSENIEGALPENALRITISRGESDNQRIFDIEGVTLEDIGG